MWTTPKAAITALAHVIGVVFLFSFFVNALSMVLPLYTMQVFDRVLGARSEDTLWAITGIAIFLLVSYGILEGVRSNVMMGVDHWLEKNLFTPIVKTRLELAAQSHAASGGAGLGDLRNLRAFFAGPSLLGVLDTLWSPLFLLVGFMIHPILGLIGTVGAAGLVILSVVNEIAMREPQKAANLLGMKVSEEIESAARSAEVVSALGMGPAMLERITTISQKGREKADLANVRATRLSSVTRIFRLIIQIAIMAIGVYLVLTEHMTAGAVFAASMIMGRGLAPFEQLQRTWTTIVSARQSYSRLQEYLTKLPPERSSMNFPPPKGNLSVENVVFAARPGEKPIISGVSFKVRPGEAVGIIGPSAAGKSTLARLLVGVWRAQGGSVRLDGVDVAAWDRVDFGQHIGYVPQDVELLGGTIRQNIARFSDASDEAVIAAAKAANAHDLIVRLPKGYDSNVGEHGALLSGGQRQRIALARALFGEPAFIVLDEPNSNLDTDGELAMVEALKRARDRGAIILIVAHRSGLLNFVDKLLVLKDGKLELYGERQAVLARLQPPRPKIVPMNPEAATKEAVAK